MPLLGLGLRAPAVSCLLAAACCKGRGLALGAEGACISHILVPRARRLALRARLLPPARRAMHTAVCWLGWALAGPCLLCTVCSREGSLRLAVVRCAHVCVLAMHVLRWARACYARLAPGKCLLCTARLGMGLLCPLPHGYACYACSAEDNSHRPRPRRWR
jgi:hypothetical protein